MHYLKALSLYNLDFPRYEIIPVIKKSLDKTEWVDYNLANARVFYADLMCSTGKPQEAIDVLDKAPLIYSSDAEYVRIKSLYEMNTAESIAKAEEKLPLTFRRQERFRIRPASLCSRLSMLYGAH